MEKKPEKIIELLKKLKAMADGGATEGERAAALNRLNHIKKEYNVTDEDLYTDEEVEHMIKFKHDEMTGNVLYGVVRAYTTDEQELDSGMFTKHIASTLGFRQFVKLKISRRHFIDIDVALKYYLNAFKNDLKPIKKEHLKKKKQQQSRQKSELNNGWWFDLNDLKRKHRISRGNLSRKFKKELADFSTAFKMKHKLYREPKKQNAESENISAEAAPPIAAAASKPLSLSELKRLQREHEAWLKTRSRVKSETLPKPIDLLNEENPLMLTN